ncbi:MAG: hypothetical protein HDT21_09405 [Ruminococcus sp.]|nr:hypothetical protein [Ruminococcus sp.]
MDNSIVRFSVYDNTNFYKIELSRTLLHFTEFDFTYFWEQCIEAGKTARKTGRLPQNIVSGAKTVVGRAHPYIEACIGTDYSEIVTDCIVEYICHSERIGLEELWARCISPKNPYEEAIFRRISEYKANRAMNRWTSIVRLQEYAKNKMNFIFDTDTIGAKLSDDTIRTRKEYFDLAVSVAANELGCPGTALPSVKLCTPATLPNAAFVVGKVSKSIYRRFSDELAEGGDLSAMEKRDCSKIRDQLAMEAYSYVKGMERPNDIEMNFALETFRETPAELYYPDSLKAAIDLEFELMVRNKIYMRKCENCGRFFTALDDNTRCDRVNSSGKTCRRQYEELVESITVEARGNMPKSGENPSAENAETANITEISPVSSVVIPPPEVREPVIVPKETEKRAQKLYNALYKRVNKGIDENEFKEWSQYLSNMKRNLKIGEATLKQYEEFLDYSDRLAKEVKLASKNKTVHAPVEKPFDMSNSGGASGNEGSGSETPAETAEEKNISEDEFVEIAQLSEKIEKNSARNVVSESPKVPQVEGTVVSSDNVKVKPFTPQAFDSVFDAMQAGSGDGEDGESPKKKEKPVEIKKPKWERISREDAFKDKDEE